MSSKFAYVSFLHHRLAYPSDFLPGWALVDTDPTDAAVFALEFAVFGTAMRSMLGGMQFRSAIETVPTADSELKFAPAVSSH